MGSVHGCALALFLVAMAGCDRAEGEVEVEVDPDLVPITPHSFFVDASFGYDPATGHAVPYELAGERTPVTLEFWVVAEEYWEEISPVSECHATLSTWDAVEAADWADDLGLVYGVELPLDADLEHDCAFLPSTWGSAEAAFAHRGWGVGIGPLDPEVESKAQEIWDHIWESEYEPYFVGGGVYGPLLEDDFEGAYAPYQLTVAYGADADMVVLDADGQPWDHTEDPGPALLLAEDLEADLPRGVYNVRHFFGLEASVWLGG